MPCYTMQLQVVCYLSLSVLLWIKQMRGLNERIYDRTFDVLFSADAILDLAGSLRDRGSYFCD